MASVEVILTQDVKTIGHIGTKKRVKLGYFRNFLMPRGLAILLNDANEAHFKVLERQREKRVAELKSEAEKKAESINGQSLTIQSKSHEGGKLYGSITAKKIVTLLNREKEIVIEERQLNLSQPIKALGEYKVQIFLHQDVTATITVSVESQESDAKQEAS